VTKQFPRKGRSTSSHSNANALIGAGVGAIVGLLLGGNLLTAILGAIAGASAVLVYENRQVIKAYFSKEEKPATA